MPALASPPQAARPAMARHEFERFRRLIHGITGIALADGKKEFLSARLGAPMRRLGCQTYAEYLALLESPAGAREHEQFINAVTTNKTDFFRESHHFDLVRESIARRVRNARPGQPRRLRLWSAGCSTGEEPYSLALTVLEALGAATGWDVRILASDIDTGVLDRARAGVYGEDRIACLSPTLRARYFQATDQEGEVRVSPALQRLVRFRSVNLVARPWPFSARFDFIFCRNVIIYFDRETRHGLVRAFAEQLARGGHLVLGHSENIYELHDLFEPLQGTIYRLVDAAPEERPEPRPVEAPAPAMPARAGMVRIVAGGVYASRDPAVVSTTLGSCVAACLYDPEAGVGGMNHFLLPEPAVGEGRATRYGVHAMEVLINRIMALGGDRRRLLGKIFGAASVLHPHMQSTFVPDANARFVREFLVREGIPIVAERLGGTDPLEVRFHTHEGRAQVRKVQRAILPAVVLDEERYEHEVEEQLEIPPKVTLFT